MSLRERYYETRRALQEIERASDQRWSWSKNYVRRLQSLADVKSVLSHLELSAGARVLDFGCGNALFSILIAQVIADSTVFAVDTDPGALFTATALVKRLGLKNVLVAEGNGNAIPSSPRSINRALHRNVLHLMSEPSSHVTALHGALDVGAVALVSCPFNDGDKLKGEALQHIERLKDPSRPRFFRQRHEMLELMEGFAVRGAEIWTLRRTFAREIARTLSNSNVYVGVLAPTYLNDGRVCVDVPFIQLTLAKV